MKNMQQDWPTDESIKLRRRPSESAMKSKKMLQVTWLKSTNVDREISGSGRESMPV